jgi:hypothetical protein
MSNGHVPHPSVGDDESPAVTKALGPARSGRTFVIIAVVAIAAIWGTLFLVFRDWRERHRALSAFGATEVATLVDPLAETAPPGVAAKTWRNAVGDTHAMLVTVTSAGLLDREGLESLRDDLRVRVARMTPEVEVKGLSKLWDEMQEKAGPVILNRSSRPPFAPPRPKVLGGKGN